MANKLNGTTHWETCATEGGRHHYNCAVARIAELEAQCGHNQATINALGDRIRELGAELAAEVKHGN